MPVDTSIYSNVAKGADFSNLANFAQQGMQIQQQKKAAEEKQTLRDIFKKNTDEKGNVNREGILTGLAQSGLGDQIANEQKQWSDIDKSKSENQSLKLKYDKDRLDFTNGQLQSLLSLPDQELTPNRVISAVTEQVNRGYLQPEEGAAFVKNLNPQTLRQNLTQLGISGLEAKQRLDALTPDVKAVDLGGTTRMVDTNAITNPNVSGQVFQKTAMPKDGKEQNKGSDALDALEIISQAREILPESTNSYGGVALDQAGRFFGASTRGAEASAKLKALEGALVAKMPKMSGPQSDKDVLLYKQMAGQIGDPTIPISQRQAALDAVEKIQRFYADKNLSTQSPKEEKPAQGSVEKVGGKNPSLRRGTMDSGYVFMGGDPSDSKNWKKIKS